MGIALTNCTAVLFDVQEVFSLLQVIERVLGIAVLPDFKMQMIAGGPAGGAHLADHTSLLHSLTGGHINLGKMSIKSGYSVSVVNNDAVTIGPW